MKYTRSFLFNSMHKDWYICEAEKQTLHKTKVVLDFYDGDPDVLERCAFMVQPLLKTERKLKNCKDVIGPVETPEISGQPLPHPPRLVPPTPAPPAVLPICMPVCPVSTMAETPGIPSSAGISLPGVSGVVPSISGKRKPFYYSLAC